jgi:phospholipase C
LDRREFLRLSALAGAAAVLLQCSSGSSKAKPTTTSTTALPKAESVLDGPAAESGIDTVVVAMMENRSFDSYFGWLARDNAYLEAGRSKYGAQFTVDGNSFQEFPGPNGTPVKTARRALATGESHWRGCGFNDPGHGWTAGRAERDGGFLAKDSGNDEFALSYFEAPDLPFYDLLARRFTVFDRWHASVLGPTYPNREYLLSGQSGGNKTNASRPVTAFSGRRSSTGSRPPTCQSPSTTTTCRQCSSGARACRRSRGSSRTSRPMPMPASCRR